MVSLLIVALQLFSTMYMVRKIGRYDKLLEANFCILEWLYGRESKISSELINYYNGGELPKRPYYGAYCKSYKFLDNPKKKISDENYNRLYKRYQRIRLVYVFLFGVTFLSFYLFDILDGVYRDAYHFILSIF